MNFRANTSNIPSRAQVPCKGQGTIEYLVIIAVVVVISLIVVGLMANLSSPGTQMSQNAGKLNAAVQSISVLQAVSGVDGWGVMVIRNNSGDGVTTSGVVLSDVNLGGVIYLSPSGSGSLQFSNMPACVAGTTKTYSVKISYVNSNGLAKTQVVDNVAVSCESSAVAVNPLNVSALDRTPPTVSLLAPGSSTNQVIVDFNYSANDLNSSITECDLFINSVQTDSNFSITKNSVYSIRKTLAFGSYTWSVVCTDGNHNVSTAQNQSLSILDNTPPTVYLLSPADLNKWTSGYTVSFDFNAIDNNAVQSCSLKVDGTDVNSVSGISFSPTARINYTFPSDKFSDWNIACTDYSSNSVIAAKRSINVDMNIYQLTTCLELQDMNLHLDGNYYLMNDVNCYADTRLGGALYNGGAGFSPIGYSPYFTGTFNGNNHYISSLYMRYPGSGGNVGLFGYTSATSRILNVGLRDVNITGSYNVGSLVGYSSGLVSGSYATGSVTGTGSDWIGGLIGTLYNGSILNCYSTANVTSTSWNTGGLVGTSFYGTAVTNSYATGSVTSTANGQNIGGLIGYNSATLSNSYATGDVNGASKVGGLIGYLGSGSVLSSYATGDVNGTNNVGGLVGEGWAAISRSYATGNVIGSYSVGGLVGVTYSPVFNSYAMGRVTGSSYQVGGLVGYCSGSYVLSSYATGDVNGVGDNVGGLVGYTTSSVKKSFSKGTVDGNKYVGGLVGYATSFTLSDVNNNYSISRVNGLNAPKNGFVGQNTNANIVSNAYWNPTLANKSNCYRDTSNADVNTNCNSGSYAAADFYGLGGIPFANLGFDGNWVSQTSGYPKLSWQTN